MRDGFVFLCFFEWSKTVEKDFACETKGRGRISPGDRKVSAKAKTSFESPTPQLWFIAAGQGIGFKTQKVSGSGLDPSALGRGKNRREKLERLKLFLPFLVPSQSSSFVSKFPLRVAASCLISTGCDSASTTDSRRTLPPLIAAEKKPQRMEWHKERRCERDVEKIRGEEKEGESCGFPAGASPPPCDRESLGWGQRSTCFNTRKPSKIPFCWRRGEEPKRRRWALKYANVRTRLREPPATLFIWLQSVRSAAAPPTSLLDIQMRAELKYLPRNKRSSFTFDFKN